MDISRVKALRASLDQALKAWALSEGVQASVGNIRYTSTTLSSKIEVVEAESARGAEAVKFAAIAWRFGYKAEDYGKIVQSKSGATYKLVGFNPKAKSYPIIGEKDGKRYKIAAESLR